MLELLIGRSLRLQGEGVTLPMVCILPAARHGGGSLWLCSWLGRRDGLMRLVCSDQRLATRSPVSSDTGKGGARVLEICGEDLLHLREAFLGSSCCGVRGQL